MKKVLIYLVFCLSLTAFAQQNQNVINENIKTEPLKIYKEKAHASYYHDKFEGRKTARSKYGAKKSGVGAAPAPKVTVEGTPLAPAAATT